MVGDEIHGVEISIAGGGEETELGLSTGVNTVLI